jgi:hypothetical protein
MYYQHSEAGRSSGSFALLRRTTLGTLTSPLRESSILDRWTPFEVALFESTLCLTGKAFAQIAHVLGSKTTAEVIEFYYVWKKSKNYQTWKLRFKTHEDEAAGPHAHAHAHLPASVDPHALAAGMPVHMHYRHARAHLPPHLHETPPPHVPLLPPPPKGLLPPFPPMMGMPPFAPPGGMLFPLPPPPPPHGMAPLAAVAPSTPSAAAPPAAAAAAPADAS